LERHLQSIKRGEDYDPESGLLHSAQVMTNAAFLTEYFKIYPQGDDRPHAYLSRNKIGLDIDEVLCDFTAGWAKLHCVDERPFHWNYHRTMGQEFKKMAKAGKLEKFYLSLQPKIKPTDIPFEPLCYVTSRPVKTEITEQWLDKHKFPSCPVITVPIEQSKVEVLKNAGVQIFVDDRFENFVELNNAGICCFLYDAPHNRRYDVGFKRIKSLMDIV